MTESAARNTHARFLALAAALDPFAADLGFALIKVESKFRVVVREPQQQQFVIDDLGDLDAFVAIGDEHLEVALAIAFERHAEWKVASRGDQDHAVRAHRVGGLRLGLLGKQD